MTSLASTSRQRFFSPKYTQYSADGFGRDTYIGYNNGGFLDKLSKLKAKDNFETFSINRHFNTKRNVAPFKYRSDGSGRDNYVLHEHAGLERDYKGLKSYHLKDFLRKEGGNNVNFLASPTKEGIRPKTLYISKKAYSAIKNMKILEKNLEERLYKPKDVHSKEDLYK
jgi:hypothetical protein